MTNVEGSTSVGRERTRSAIVDVAAELLHAGGAAAVTTRAVAAAAGVQPPAIYRLFGDRDGLLDAVAEHVFSVYVRGKDLGVRVQDPLADLDAGWETHIGFGLSNPALFAILVDPGRATRSPAAAAGLTILKSRVHRIAAAGRLRVSERRAVEMIHAAGTGVVLTLLAMPPGHRDPGLANAVYGAVKDAIITSAPTVPGAEAGTTMATTAVALRAELAKGTVLSAAENGLITEWLDRIADQ